MEKSNQSIDVLGYNYKLTLTADKRDLAEGVRGTVSWEPRTITLYNGEELQRDEVRLHLLHELVHIILFGLFYQNEKYKALCVDEAFVKPFSAALFDTLNRNNLIEWKVL